MAAREGETRVEDEGEGTVAVTSGNESMYVICERHPGSNFPKPRGVSATEDWWTMASFTSAPFRLGFLDTVTAMRLEKITGCHNTGLCMRGAPMIER